MGDLVGWAQGEFSSGSMNGCLPLTEQHSQHSVHVRACTLLPPGSGDRMIRVWTVEPCCPVAKTERADAEYNSHNDAISSLEWRPDHPDVLASCSNSKNDTNIRCGAAA
jgi:WD40 repeat protein